MDQGVKKADDILDTAVSLGKITASEAKRASESLRERVAVESGRAAPSGGSGGRSRPAAGSRADALEALARLGELRKARVITEKEFKEKKAKLLEEV